MIENRRMMMRLTFPKLFAQQLIEPVGSLPGRAAGQPAQCGAGCDFRIPPSWCSTPGAHNSAYFEHAFLAQQMGVQLVEGQDPFVRDAMLYMRTTRGLQRVDVIYRRVDDDFLDPLAFRADSMLGVPGPTDGVPRGPRDHLQCHRHRHCG